MNKYSLLSKNTRTDPKHLNSNVYSILIKKSQLLHYMPKINSNIQNQTTTKEKKRRKNYMKEASGDGCLRRSGD